MQPKGQRCNISWCHPVHSLAGIVFDYLGFDRRFQVYTIVYTASTQYFTGNLDFASTVLVPSKVMCTEHSTALFC